MAHSVIKYDKEFVLKSQVIKILIDNVHNSDILPDVKILKFLL